VQTTLANSQSILADFPCVLHLINQLLFNGLKGHLEPTFFRFLFNDTRLIPASTEINF